MLYILERERGEEGTLKREVMASGLLAFTTTFSGSIFVKFGHIENYETMPIHCKAVQISERENFIEGLFLS